MYQEEGGEKMSKNKKRKMIREGKEESIIERLEEYILPVYPEWREKRIPARKKLRNGKKDVEIFCQNRIYNI